MGTFRRAAWVGLVGLACGKSVGTGAPQPNAVVLTVVLPAGFTKPVSEELHIIIDEKPGAASLFSAARAASTSTILENVSIQSEISDTFDADSNFEWRGRVMGWPFSANGTWVVDLEGEVAAEFRIIARVVSANVTHAEGAIDVDRDGGALRFGPVARYATVTMACLVGCGGGDGGADAGDGGADADAGDGGADADAGAGADAGDGGADAGDGGADADAGAGADADAGAVADAGADADAGMDVGWDGGYMPWDAGLCTYGPPTLVARGNPAVSNPVIATAYSMYNGGIVAVWSDTVGSRVNIVSSRYDYASGLWSDAGLIGVSAGGDSDKAALAIDMMGNRWAVWQQFDGARLNIMANRFRADAGARWGDAGRIDYGAYDAREPVVGFDGFGSAHAVWLQSDGVNNGVWSSRYHGESDRWYDAGRASMSDASAAHVRAAVDYYGDVTAVWYEQNGARYNIWANRYASALGRWDDAGMIETNDVGNAGLPDVKVDGMRNAIAVWEQHTGMRWTIYANRFSFGAMRWGDAGIVDTDGAGDSYEPHVGMDGAGNAVVVWYRDVNGRSSVWANRYVADGGYWGDAGRIAENDGGTVDSPKIAVDWMGNAAVIWTQIPGAEKRVYVNRWVADGGRWDDAGLLHPDTDPGGADMPTVAVDPMGRPIVVWRQYNAVGPSYDIWASICR